MVPWDGPGLTVADIVTWWPPGTGATDRTRLVTTACALLMLAIVSYTQVLPTAMGNRISPAGTTWSEVAPGVAPPLAVAAGFEVALEAALADVPAAGVPFAAAPDVPADAHPASATTTAPANAARADLYLIMWMPRPMKLPCEV